MLTFYATYEEGQCIDVPYDESDKCHLWFLYGLSDKA